MSLLPDVTEFGVVETGGPINGILVAASTNATVKIQKVLI